jgi:hypothetical protein
MPTVFVDIPVLDFWPSQDDLAARDRVIASLDALGIGSLIGCGGGRGAVDLSYRVTDTAWAMKLIQCVVLDHFPTAQPRICIAD